MSVYHKMRNIVGGMIPLLLLTFFMISCGSSTTGSTVASTPTATACLTAATGTIQSVNGSSLQLNSVQGKTVQVTLTSKTVITRQATLTIADLKTGMPVSVTVRQNSDNTYSALMVSVRGATAERGVFIRGSGSASTLCGGQRPRRTGTPGTFGGPGSGAAPGSGSGSKGQNFQTISGTLSQVNPGSLVVTDTSNNDFTVTINSSTRMTQQQTIAASNLRTGEAVTVAGNANSQGVISASNVAVLQALPFRRITPKLTPTTTGA